MAHPNEPGLEELKALRNELYRSESTDDNLRKIKAIEAQIQRREAEVPSTKAEIPLSV